MANKTVVWTLSLLILSIFNCESHALKNGPESSFEFEGTKNFNGQMLTSYKYGIEPETEGLKFPQKQNYKVTERNVRNFSFAENMEKCIKNHQYEITLNFTEGKTIILNCVKKATIINLFQYLTVSPNFSVSFFNGLFELSKIPDPLCDPVKNSRKLNDCKSNYFKTIDDLEQNWRISEDEIGGNNIGKRNGEELKSKISAEEQLRRIEAQQNNLVSDVLKSFSSDYWGKKEIEELKSEINDSNLLDTFDALTRNYVLRIKYLPGATATIRRGNNSKLIFDVDIEEHSTSVDEDEEYDDEVEGNWRQSRLDYSSESEESQSSQQSQQPSKKKKKKKKKQKKEEKESRKQQKQKKKVAKHFSYLILPVIIQLALLPFVLKKLFFLAMGALTAAKIAILLVVYRLLRNLKVQDENYYLRLEHYGYKEGEEYGAWVNGRRFRRSLINPFSDTPFTSGNTSMIL